MILHIVGQIGVGKSTFCRHLLQARPGWKYLTLDECRLESITYYSEYYPAEPAWPEGIEGRAWYSLQQKLARYTYEYNHCLLETTGASWRLSQLWNERLATEGIYTIKLTAPIAECIQRVRARKNTMPHPYDGDEVEAIQLTEELIDKVPANLVIDIGGLEQGSQELLEVYQSAELFIERAVEKLTK